jgi:ABC-type glycerol-3-phosphate transport system permease component
MIKKLLTSDIFAILIFFGIPFYFIVIEPSINPVCYTPSQLQEKAKIEGCSDLGFSDGLWTIVCPNSEGDTYIDFKEKNGKFCKYKTEHL